MCYSEFCCLFTRYVGVSGYYLHAGSPAAAMPPFVTVQPPIAMAFNIRTALYLTCAASGFPPPT